ncbi:MULTISPECIES: hypothetical protein [Shewanella]|uniref:hypothetical protein n=1 Tax=Shewanella TaxID=22 RepID=UPI00200DB010|nr:hypothetical protein [Shewanella kaireitica]MCL1096169.1 hypothetical protein [Shewanella kaireitica]
MELYKQEFGQQFELGFDLTLHPWLVDKSWHNDVSPSFYFTTPAGFMVLWVDYEDPKQREDTEQDRYVVMTAVNSGTDEYPEIHHDEESTVVFSSNQIDSSVAYLLSVHTAKVAHT